MLLGHRHVQDAYAALVDGHTDDAEYDVASFFMHCYHLRDWLIADGVVPKASLKSEALASKYPALALCGDVCNGQKHARLKWSITGDVTTRLERNISVRLAALWIDLSTGESGSDGESTVAYDFHVSSGGRSVDALQLADECLREWRAVFKDHGLDEAEDAAAPA